MDLGTEAPRTAPRLRSPSALIRTDFGQFLIFSKPQFPHLKTGLAGRMRYADTYNAVNDCGYQSTDSCREGPGAEINAREAGGLQLQRRLGTQGRQRGRAGLRLA